MNALVAGKHGQPASWYRWSRRTTLSWKKPANENTSRVCWAGSPPGRHEHFDGLVCLRLPLIWWLPHRIRQPLLGDRLPLRNRFSRYLLDSTGMWTSRCSGMFALCFLIITITSGLSLAQQCRLVWRSAACWPVKVCRGLTGCHEPNNLSKQKWAARIEKRD